MTHRTERGDHVRVRRWLPWVVLALAVVFLTRGFDHGIRIDGIASLIPLIVIAAVGYFLWTWWIGDDEAEDGEASGSARARRRRHGHLDHAERVLRERFANGEIDEDEYLARKSVLED
jgi:uncharacterized membrane protein